MDEDQVREWQLITLLNRLPRNPELLKEVELWLTDNDKLAYRADTELLASIWEIRYGNGWVGAAALGKEGFMVAVLVKLISTTPWVKTKEMAVVFDEDIIKDAMLVHSKPAFYKVEAQCK